MAKSYPEELREKVIAFVAAGNSRREAARQFGVSASFVVKLLQKGAPDASLPPPPRTETPPLSLDSQVVSGADLADLLGVSRRSVSEFAERGIIHRIGRNRFSLQQSIRLYCEHLRSVAAGRGGDGTQELTAARARLAKEQADATALKNAESRKQLVQKNIVEREWTTISRKIRNAVLAVPSRARQTLPHLTSFDVEQIDREIREALLGLGHDDDSTSGTEASGLDEHSAAAEAAAVGVD